MEGWSVADSSEVHGDGGAMTDQSRAGETRKPSGAKGMMLPGGADRSMGQAGTKGSEGRGGARDFSRQGRAPRRIRADGGAEGLKGASLGGAEGIAGFGGVCRRRMGEEAGSVMDRTAGDDELELGMTTGDHKDR